MRTCGASDPIMHGRTGIMKWKCLFGGLIVYGFVLTVLSDTICDDAMKNVTKTYNYADNIGSSDMKVCCEYIQIKCDEDYAAPLMEKRPTCYGDVGDSCEYMTILFFGRYDDYNKTTLLWLVMNVEPEDLKNGFHGDCGNEIVIYTKPKSSVASAPHFFFVYQQQQKSEPFFCGPEERDNFDIKKFAADNNLGNPILGLYFRVTATGQLMKYSTYTKGNRRGSCPRPM